MDDIKYIINPNYFLSTDKNVFFITDRDIHALGKDISITSDFFYFIHPMHYYVLSKFDGRKDLDDCIDEIADEFELDKHDVRNYIEPFIENKEEYCVEFDGNYIQFPKNTIVRNVDDTIIEHPRVNISALDFRKADISNNRLNSLLDLVYVINNKCVTDCIYCYADKSTKVEGIDITTFSDLVCQAKNENIRSFDINGGELFLQKNWDVYLEILIKNSFNPYISTKIPLSENIILKLSKIGVKRIQISIDSFDKDELKEILCVGDDYRDRMIQTIKILDMFGFEIRTNTIITSVNTYNSIKELLFFLLEIESIKSINIQAAGYSLYKESYDAYKPKIELLDRVSDLVKLLRKSTDKALDFGGFEQEENYLNIENRKDEFRNRGLCSGNTRGLVVLPNGDVTICEELYWHPNFLIGNVKDNKLNEIWRSDKALKLFNLEIESVNPRSECSRCGEFKSCRQGLGVCWKMVLYAYGKENWDNPDPRCAVAPKYANEFFI